MGIVYGLLVLEAIVFLHELGHYAVGRLLGMDVESFSLGFGPVIFHREAFGTDWRISLVPLGGYCAFRDEAFDEFAVQKDGSYGAARPIFRAAVNCAGPLVNFIVAFMALAVAAMSWKTAYSQEPVVEIASESVHGVHSAAGDAGIMSGDRIVSIDGERVAAFSDIRRLVSDRPGEVLEVVFERNGTSGAEMKSASVKVGQSGDAGVLGVVAMKEKIPPEPFFRAVASGFSGALKMVRLTVGVFSPSNLRAAFGGRGIVDGISENVAGPVQIMSLIGDTASSGLPPFLYFVALVNVSLFVLNMLPVAPFDGFGIVLAFVEIFFRRRPSKRVRSAIGIFGTAVIASLFCVAVLSDFVYIQELLKNVWK